MAIILITGGSGLIGRAVTESLLSKGHTVRHLTRAVKNVGSVRSFLWDPGAGTMDPEALEGVDHIIHLSGAGIADKRWSGARMRELYMSRGGAARLLLSVSGEGGMRPKSFISASGIGYYGAVTTDHVFTESDPPGTDAIARLTKDWEDAAEEWSPICRVVRLRTPMVLTMEGGALKRLSAPFHFGLGAAIGSGHQWMPWIHRDDIVAAYVKAVEDERMSGAYNVVVGDQPRNADFMRAVAKALHRPFFLPNVPAMALRLALGEMSCILLDGSRANNARILAAGMRLRYSVLADVLRDALERGDAQATAPAG